jgi:hypothetical protein
LYLTNNNYFGGLVVWLKICVYICTLNQKNTMAKIKSNTSTAKMEKSQVSRPGVHAKTKTSASKTSKLYKKKYRGQGR